MKLATTTGDFGAYVSSQQESVRLIHQAGFRYADYNFGMDYNRQDGIFAPAGDWRAHIRNVKETAESLSMKFVQAHSPMGAPIRRGEGHAEFVEATRRCIEACAMLGVENLVVHSGYEMGLTKEQTFERNKEFYMELLNTAEELGVNILVENFNKMCVEGMYWIDNAADLKAQIDCINHPMLHACWDAGHGNLQDMPQDEELRILGSHVRAVHIQDNKGDTDSHMAPFFGTLNLDSLMHGLIDIGYTGYFTFESGNILLPGKSRRSFEKDTRLTNAPLSLRVKAESFLYEIGRCVLDAYGCFEE